MIARRTLDNSVSWATKYWVNSVLGKYLYISFEATLLYKGSGVATGGGGGARGARAPNPARDHP